MRQDEIQNAVWELPFCCCDKILWSKQLVEAGKERIYLIFTSKSAAHHWEKSEQNSSRNCKQKPWRNLAYWLSLLFSQGDVHLASLYSSGPASQRVVPSTVPLGSSISVSNQDAISQTCSRTSIIKTIIQLRLFYFVSHIILNYIKLKVRGYLEYTHAEKKIQNIWEMKTLVGMEGISSQE